MLKLRIYNTVTGTVETYGFEKRTLGKAEQNMLGLWVLKVLRKIQYMEKTSNKVKLGSYESQIKN